MVQLSSEYVPFEAVVPSETGRSMFDQIPLAPQNLQQFAPSQERARDAGRQLQAMGFRVRHIGTFSVSGEAPRHLWEEVFGTRVESQTRALSETHPEAGSVSFLSHIPNVPFTIPPQLENIVERAYPQLPPTFFESPLPPRVNFHHLRVPGDLAALLRSSLVQR